MRNALYSMLSRRSLAPLTRNLQAGFVWFLTLTLLHQPLLAPVQAAAPPAFPRAATPLVTVPQSNVDLTVTALDLAGISTDSQTLALAGTLGVTVNNLGGQAVTAPFRLLAFEDRNGNQAFNTGTDLLLGTALFTAGVNANAAAQASLTLSGTVAFKGNFIYVMVDSDNVIVETNETNNIRQSDLTPAPLAFPDLIPSYLRKDSTRFPASVELTARVGNSGKSRSSVEPTFGPNLLQNGSFEESDPSINPGKGFTAVKVGETKITGWTVIGLSNKNVHYVGTLWQAAEGQRSVDLDGAVGSAAGVAQTIATVPGHKYQVQFAMAGNYGNKPVIKPMRVSAAQQSSQFNFDTTGKSSTNMGYERKIWGFTATDPTTTLRFESLTTATGAPAGWGPVIDAVEVREITNENGGTGNASVKVSFYRGDPAAGGTLVGTTQTTKALAPGEYEDVKIIWNSPQAGLHPIVVVADDDGTGKGIITEGDETNNKAGANILLGVGPFPLVDDLLARFKDGLVDVRWSPISGAASYNLYRAEGNQSRQMLKKGLTTPLYADSALTSGATYFYTVTWMNPNGVESGFGTEASATPTLGEDRLPNPQRTNGDVPPTILSAPLTRASVNQPYAYTVRAIDPDRGDTLRYELTTAPLGMTINAATGNIQWTPTLQQAGYQDVSVKVTDTRARLATQSYHLFVDVLSEAHAPVITSAPVTTSQSGSLYQYQVTATDADPGDLLTFALGNAPVGMTINEYTGLMTWTAAPNADGSAPTVTVQVKDLAGLIGTQTYDLTVGPPNLPPQISSSPITKYKLQPAAGTGELQGVYEYRVLATDGNNDALTYRLTTAPTGMTIDAATGLIRWSLRAAQIGRHRVTIQVEDPGGLSATQSFLLEIAGLNNPPTFISTPLTFAALNQPYRYLAQATDPDDGDKLTYTLVTGPNGLTVDAQTGLVQWTPTSAGTQPLQIRVSDQTGLSATQSFTLTVAANQPPVITSAPFTGGAVNYPYLYPVLASDPNAGDILTYRLVTAPTGMTIDATTGQITWVPTQTGSQPVTVQVQDQSQAAATQSFTINVTAAPQLPTVAFTAPAPGSVITQITDVLGSASDPNGSGAALTWKLELRREGSTEYQLLGSGTGAVSNSKLAALDPTMLRNDGYYLRLTGRNAYGEKSLEYPYSISGELKLGNFTVAFTDLTIPLAGIPIAITRSYDSLDTTKKDFGAGWRLGLAGEVVDTASESPKLESFTNATRVYVTRPDGRREGFTFVPVPSSPFFQYVLQPTFRPDPGVTDTLEVSDGLFTGTSGNYHGTNTAIPYNPRLYTLKTKEGITYTIDELDGLKKITDNSGNTIDVTPNGLVSSTGVSVAFQRDAMGRIEKITEPTPNEDGSPRVLTYQYDASGNLRSFTDQVQKTTTYSYENPQFPHYLTKIEDPLGRAVTRNVYDNAGRLIGLCDANGNPATLAGCVKLDPNATGKVQTLVNARGYRTDLILDERGNVLTERRWLDGVKFLDTVRTYDPNNNLLTEKDSLGNTKTFTYDKNSNQLTATDAGGRTTTYTYQAKCNRVETVKDPAGNLTRYTYDAQCNLRSVRDALNNSTLYNYNARGQRTEMIDPNGSKWVWGYDNNGFLQSLTDPFGKATQFKFNASGELLYRIDRNQRRIDFKYDNTHRLREEKWDTTPARLTTYTYTDTGQLKSAVDPDSALTMEYYPTGLVKSVDNAGTPGAPRVLISYQYDENGNVKAVQDSLGGVTGYQYDALERLERITQSGTNVNEKRVDIKYDDASFLRELRRFSNLAGTQGVANTFYDYDCGGCSGRLKSIHHRKASDNSVIHDLDFERDALGNIKKATDAEGTHIYTYDALRRLKTATHSQPTLQPNEFYNYDAVGNRLNSHLSSNYAYSYQGGGKENRLLQDDQFSYQYDDEGNLTRRTELLTGSYLEFIYDHRNRTTAIIQRNSIGTEQRFIRYSYDSIDRRIGVNEKGVVTYFGYDDLNPTLTISASGKIISRRLYGIAIDLIFATESSSSTRWIITDQIETVRDLLGDNSVRMNHNIYDSFGRLLPASSPSADNDILFTSREFNSSGSIGYYRSRLYEPSIGRFQQTDPLLPFQYLYAGNNPLIFIDPLGLTIIEYIKTTANRVRQSTTFKYLSCGIQIALIINRYAISTVPTDQMKFLVWRSLRYKAVAECTIDPRGPFSGAPPL